MKFKTLIFSLLVGVVFLSSCDEEVDILGNWKVKAFFNGLNRSEGTSFSINNIGYFGLGKDEDEYLSDFWKYDPVNNSWTQLGNFPGTPRAFNAYTNTADKGYMGLGSDGKVDYNDFWEYNPSTDTWTQIPDFIGVKRREAVAFAIGNTIYVGTGTSEKGDVDHNDFYKYSDGQWSSIAGLTGQKRRSSTAVTLEGKGYLISGFNRSGTNIDDFWCYDPASDSWSQLDKLTDDETGVEDGSIARYNAVAFVVDSKIYLATGVNRSGNSLSTCYEWNPTSKIWTEKTSLEASARNGASAFVLNNAGYVLCGNYSYPFDDLWMFEPYVEVDEDDNE